MCSWQVSSLNESITNQILQLKPAQLVRFNQRQLIRVYPSNYRVDSSNFNPQPFWNAGCHLGLNYLFFLSFIMNYFLSNYHQSLLFFINDETAKTLIWTAMDHCWQMAFSFFHSCAVHLFEMLFHLSSCSQLSNRRPYATAEQGKICSKWKLRLCAEAKMHV